MHGERLHKMFQRDSMARDPRRDLLGQDRDILLRDQNETWGASVRDWDVKDFVRDETETLVRLETTSLPNETDILAASSHAYERLDIYYIML